ncbi:hypothetical protein GCM10010168_56370 [Actinoplanes ianthinogenes]|uniref:DUF4132 domain-containing protein n=1 Tax=Actinoplanes ianthinogenes TaxID=122358 RepID=A0ABN6CLM5_9ACTN|nr:DUF4132 domain-containing protein [Actinoplanes ianthinogenes]BCJ45943.1 hypothetical protein Aiant_66000 [Actinoplanes ianthinogenes]GGR30988.1 hypothetical protein GCM10010168_56370 [Actinoplanes ianthinogenes]
MGWVPAGAGYEVSIDGRRVIARTSEGKALKSLPKAIKDHEAVAGLRQLVEWLQRHEETCRAEVERWMIRSLPVPVALIAQVWADEAWRAVLRDLVVVPVGADSPAAALLRDADQDKGLGVVDLDGESTRITTEQVLIPHPVRLPDLDDLREFAADLGVEQGTLQLFREVWHKPADPAEQQRELRRYADAAFKELRHAQTRATSAGYRVQGGTAVCRIWEDGRSVVASVWIGDGDPGYETVLSELSFTDAAGEQLAIADVPPVAWSEGLRMAAHLHAGRAVEEEQAA